MDNNYNYPIPDPTWDYAGVWHSLQAAKDELVTLLDYMAEIEDANAESDRLFRDRLDSLQIKLDGAKSLLNS